MRKNGIFTFLVLILLNMMNIYTINYDILPYVINNGIVLISSVCLDPHAPPINADILALFLFHFYW